MFGGMLAWSRRAAVAALVADALEAVDVREDDADAGTLPAHVALEGIVEDAGQLVMAAAVTG